MTVSEAVLVRVEDWEGLYINDELVAENHTLDLFYELDGKTLSFHVRNERASDEEYVMNAGGFPSTYDELIDYQYMWEEDHRDD